MSPPVVLTADQLAARWGVTKAHVYRLSRTGKIPVLKLGKHYRYPVAAIEAYERDNCQLPEGQAA